VEAAEALEPDGDVLPGARVTAVRQARYEAAPGGGDVALVGRRGA
jgi:hypothetical protein